MSDRWSPLATTLTGWPIRALIPAWDQDKVRDALGRYLAWHLGEPAAVLIADDTGFEKSRQALGGRH